MGRYITALLLLASHALSDEAVPWHIHPCKDKIAALVAKWGPPAHKWIKQPAGSNKFRWFAPTSEIGQWIVYEPSESVTRLSKISSVAVVNAEFKNPICIPGLKVRKTGVQNQDGLSDTNLKDLLQKKGVVLLYTWSPGMPLSAKGLLTIENVARKLDGRTLVLLDPTANITDAKKVLKQNGLAQKPEWLKKPSGIEPGYLGLLQHYPSAALVFGGRRTFVTVPGLMTEDEYLQVFGKDGSALK